MKKAKLMAAKKGILFFDRVSYGDEGKRIVEIAQKNNFDLIVIGSRGMGAKGYSWEVLQITYFINQKNQFSLQSNSTRITAHYRSVKHSF